MDSLIIISTATTSREQNKKWRNTKRDPYGHYFLIYTLNTQIPTGFNRAEAWTVRASWILYLCKKEQDEFFRSLVIIGSKVIFREKAKREGAAAQELSCPSYPCD